jgi:hypothetical protein
MTKPQRRETVAIASEVLSPWKRMSDATSVAVEKPT